MSFATRCRHEVLTGDRRRGESYFQAGKAVAARRTESSYTATVYGSVPYRVAVAWERQDSGGTLSVACECPRFEGGAICKHVWATLLRADADGVSARVAGDGPLLLEPLHFEEAWSRATGRGVARRPTPRPSEAEPGPAAGWGDVASLAEWQRQFRILRAAATRTAGERPPAEPGCEAWFRINLAACRRRGRLEIDLYQRRQPGEPGRGRLHPTTVDESSLERFPDQEDREILGLLLAAARPHVATGGPAPAHLFANTDHSIGRFVLPAALYRLLLPRLCATGRCGWYDPRRSSPQRAAPLVWDDGKSWGFALALTLEEGPDGEGRVGRLWGRLTRGEESRSLEDPLLLLADGLVLFADRLAPLEAGSAFAWISLLRKCRAIVVPEAELEEMLGELWSLPARPTLSAAADWDLREVRLEPRPRLALTPLGHGEPPPLDVELGFDYDGLLVAADDPRAWLIDLPGRRALTRELEAERRARAELRACGLDPSPRPGPPRREANGTGAEAEGPGLRIATDPLCAALEHLLEDGWSITVERRPLRRPRRLRLRAGSGVDWLDLRGEAEFGESSLPLSELVKAVRRGEPYVVLADGSSGLLPRQWTDRIAPLARLAAGEEEGRLRFERSQVLLLDALLAPPERSERSEPSDATEAPPAEIEVDRGFARLRDRLRTVHGVSPAGEPRGFRGELRGYQRAGLGWLRFLGRAGLGGCLADDMGLGKTVQVLALLQKRRLARRGGSRPSLVVVPRSLVYNWIEEARRFTPRLRLLDYTGERRGDLRSGFAECDLVVTTYGTLRRDLLFLRRQPFDYVILDEGQAIKNPTSQSAKAARLLQADHRLALSGTPVENHLGELASLFDFLNPGMLGHLPSLRALEPGRSGRPSPELERTALALRPLILRRTKQEVLADLPAKTEQTLVCELQGEERRRYTKLRDHYRRALAERIAEVGIERSGLEVLEALLRLRQAACHPGLLEPGMAGQPSAKLDTLLAQLAEVLTEGHKALVFSQFTRLLAILRTRLDDGGLTYEYLDGRTRDRRRRVRRFQSDPDCPLFLISLRAGGLGLNLTAADYVFILDPWWNPAVEAQAIDRAHRLGQRRPVFAYRLIARHTVEEKIAQLQEWKRDLAEAILTPDSGLVGRLTAEDLELLLA